MELKAQKEIDNNSRPYEEKRCLICEGIPVEGKYNKYTCQHREYKVVRKINREQLTHNLAGSVLPEGPEYNRCDNKCKDRYSANPEGDDQIV